MTDATSQLDLGFRVEETTYVPPSDWTPPDELPDRLYGPMAIDVETKDPDLKKKGPGWAWGNGHIVGYSITADNFSGYLPVRHEGGGNMDPDLVERWVRHVVSVDDTQPKLFAKAMYDVGWMAHHGIQVRGPMYDVQWAEALLDEHRWSYSLNSLGKSYLNREKNETLLREAANAYGVDPKGELYKLPAPLVGPYGQEDSVLTRDVWMCQKPKLDEQDLWPIFELEHALLPMYLDMRTRGVRVDVDYAEQLKKRWKARVQEQIDEIHRRTGVRIDIWAAASIAKALDTENIPYGRTPKTNQPQIDKNLLERTDHWLTKAILAARELDKLAGTFIDGQILNLVQRGRVHGEIHPLKSDEGGTTTGRLSMSSPNLQFIPTRTEEGREIRRCFLPEEGEEWASPDISQQEPRLLVHFASLTKVRGEHLPGAIEARDRYRADPDMSYHDFAAELTGLPYKAAKILNLAIIYGRGVGNTAAQLGKTIEETRELFETHHREMPFARALSRVCQDRVVEQGFIRSLLGRRVRFPHYEPADWNKRDGRMYELWKAKKVWPNERLVIARLHKALNSLIQPSAADQTKKAMLDVWQAGLGRHVMIQVHDELCLSVPDRRIGHQVADIMRNAVKLEVPVKVDIEFGPNWGDAK